MNDKLAAIDAELQAEVEEEFSVLETARENADRATHRLYERKVTNEKLENSTEFTETLLGCSEISLQSCAKRGKYVRLHPTRQNVIRIAACSSKSPKKHRKEASFVVMKGKFGTNTACILCGTTDDNLLYMTASSSGIVHTSAQPKEHIHERQWIRDVSFKIHPGFYSNASPTKPRLLIHQPISIESRGKPNYYITVDHHDELRLEKFKPGREFALASSFYVFNALSLRRRSS